MAKKQRIETINEPEEPVDGETGADETPGLMIVWDEENQQFTSPKLLAEAQAKKSADIKSDALKELELMKKWKSRLDAITVGLESAKTERSRWQGEINKLQKNFDALYNKGPNGVADETPLLDQPNVDPDAWKQESIEKSDMPLKLKKKLGEHFQCLGELSYWIGKDFSDKKKGLGPKVREEIAEWFDGYWKETLDAELARVSRLRPTELEKIGDDADFPEEEDDEAAEMEEFIADFAAAEAEDYLEEDEFEEQENDDGHDSTEEI